MKHKPKQLRTLLKNDEKFKLLILQQHLIQKPIAKAVKKEHRIQNVFVLIQSHLVC